jgi:hypothetical protein
MRRIFAFLFLFGSVLFCAGCGGAEDTNTTVNTSTNINTNTNGNTNTVEATNTNATVNTNSTEAGNTTRDGNGNRGNKNGRKQPFNRNNSNNQSLTGVNANAARSSSTPQKTDKITVDYPNLFLQDDTGEVAFILENVAGAVTTTTTTNGNRSESTDKPGEIAGAEQGTLSPKVDPDKYDVYVEVKLSAYGLDKIDPPNLKRLYRGQREKWVWRLKPNAAMKEGAVASFSFEVNVTWQAKTTEVKTVENSGVWRNNRFDVPVGPPAGQVTAARVGSPVFAAGGVVTIGTSKRRRKKRKGAPEDEADEDEPETEDEVSGTVYAPSQAAQGDSFLVQVFIHLPEQAAALDELARAADEDSRRRISSKLQKKIKRGTELTFHLQMPGLAVDDDVQSAVWQGEPLCIQFGVSVPEACAPRNILGTVIVSEESVPVGHLRFKFKITGVQSPVGEQEETSHAEPEPAGHLTRFQQAFISYASRDRQEVLKRVQMLNVAKIKFFQDLLTLEPGDEWEKLLYDYIDKSDVFFLFWSKAAAESEWVKREVEYAIKRRADKNLPDPEIIPVIIEGPPPAAPPKELGELHFNDKLIYFINTRETAAQSGQS